MTARIVMRACVLLLAAAVVAGGVWIAGRPQRLDHAAVERRLDTVESSVAEGELLARIAARGDSPARTTRVRATELAEALQTSDSELRTAGMSRRDRVRVARVTSLGARGAELLEQLAEQPGVHATQVRGRDQLGQVADGITRVRGSGS